jgi:hypothetical protein
MFKLDPLEGTNSGHLTIVARASDSRTGVARYFTRCVCGTETLELISDLTGDRALQSCGCKGAKQPPRPWTNEEDDILRKEYPSRGWLVSEDLQRSAYAVRNRAKLLGVKTSLKRKYIGKWSEADDEVLRTHYATDPVKALELLPARTKEQIRHRAHKLGLKVEKGHRVGQWEPREDRILKRLYPKGGVMPVMEQLPRRSRMSVMKRAQHFGLTRVAPWTRKETKTLREVYPDGGIVACREHFPDKSDASINHKVRKLGLVRNLEGWTDQEIAILHEFYPKEGRVGVMARLPHRTYGTIAYKCRTLGIKFDGWWTEEQIEMVRTHYPKLGAKAVAEMVGHTAAAVQGKVHELKLTHQRIWTPEEVDILMKVYPTEGSAGCDKLLPNHSVESIRSKANALKIYTNAQGGGKRRRDHSEWEKAA